MTRKRKKSNPKPIGNINDPMSLYNYLLRYLEYCNIQNLAARTIEMRRIFSRSFIIWCDERALKHPADITKPILERYQRHLYLKRKADGQPLGISSQCNNLVAIKMFFKWLSQQNYILYNPASDLEMPRIPKRLPKCILSANEVDSILNQPDISSASGIRDRAIMEVFYSTGIRRKELSDLKTSDIDMYRGTLMVVHGKGDKDRMIPIGERAISWIQKYLNEVRSELVIGISGHTLFLNLYGDSISVTWLSALVTKYIKQADIGKQGSCHLFRHSMATMMLENGADIRYVQMMLGHADIKTTQIYTQVSIQKLKEIHTATHPAKNQKNQKVQTDGTEDLEPKPESKTLG